MSNKLYYLGRCFHG